MRLLVNRPSPYGRKVLVAAHEKQTVQAIEVVLVDPWADSAELLTVSPLGKVPVLDLGDGQMLTESTTICEYLDQAATGASLIGPNRWSVMSRLSLANGLIDAAFAATIESRRPQELRWPQWLDRQSRARDRILDRLEAPQRGRFDLADLTLAVALAYLDYRYPASDWRQGREELSRWMDGVYHRPSMIATDPRIT